MAIYDFFLSRNGAPVTQETYIGHTGRLFYDDATGEIRISDGATPGGLPIPASIATSTTAGAIKPGALLSVTSGGVLNVNYSGSFSAGGAGINTLTLNPASQTMLGGIKLSPGITTNAEGQLLIDAAGLEFTFGDFSGTVGTYSDSTSYALLQSLNADEDIVIASNGTGSVNVVGEFNVFATNTEVTDALESHQPIFRVLGDGQVRMLVPAADTLAGAFEIVGNDSGFFHPTNQTGVILHTTGNTDTVNRVYHDAINNYPIIVGRRYNGTIGALENVKDGDVIFRIAGQASTGTDFETFGPAKINWMATEDQGPTNQGGKITIDVTANGTTAFGNVITVAEFTEDGIKSTSIIPQLDEIFSLGAPDKRWANVYIGQASLFLSDKTTDEQVEITVDDGTLLLNGVSNLQIGSMRITNNVLTTVNTASDIVIGITGDTGYIKLERDLKFSDGTVQSTAWTDEHYANTLLGTTLAENVLNSSLTSVGTLLNLTVTNPIVGSMSAALTAGTYLTSGGTYNGGTARTFAVDATTTNTASKVVARDASGNFAAGTITANLTGTASTATNLTAATSILAGTLNVDPPAIGKNGSATATYTLTGLTTNHKVIVMPQAALPDEFNITASWASAANTLSIQYQTYGGGVDAAAFDIAYWAWV